MPVYIDMRYGHTVVKVFTFLLLLTFIGCIAYGYIQAQAEAVTNRKFRWVDAVGISPVTEFEYEGCRYLINTSTGHFIHKQNCANHWWPSAQAGSAKR